MGGQYNRSHSITLSPQGSEKQPVCRALDVYQRSLAEGLYKTDMLTAMAEQKYLTSSVNSRYWSTAMQVSGCAGILCCLAGDPRTVDTRDYRKTRRMKRSLSSEDRGVQVIRV